MLDIFSLKVEEIASKIRDAQLTSVEVCEKYIERINKYEKDTKIKREKCTLIRSTFNETNNISATSRKLGVSRTTIYKHLQ